MSNERLYLQQTVESYKRPPSVSAMNCGKGGISKTNIAANRAICPVASCKKVLFIGNRFTGRAGHIVHDDTFLRKLLIGSSKVIGQKADKELRWVLCLSAQQAGQKIRKGGVVC